MFQFFDVSLEIIFWILFPKWHLTLTFKSHKVKMVNLHFLFLISVTSKRVPWFCWLACNSQVPARCEKLAYLEETLVLTWWSTWFHLLCKLPPTHKVDLEWKEAENTLNMMTKITSRRTHRLPHLYNDLRPFLEQNNFLEGGIRTIRMSFPTQHLENVRHKSWTDKLLVIYRVSIFVSWIQVQILGAGDGFCLEAEGWTRWPLLGSSGSKVL